MSKIILPIDTKSLYLNIKNDNECGHTATVNTNIKQGKTFNKQLAQIYQLVDKEINLSNKPLLVENFIKNSKAEVKITNAYCFNKVSVNGIPLNTDYSFCMFIKEEVDPTKFHYGRRKLHYPKNLTYSDYQYEINNKKIIQEISSHLMNYAFLVRQFEYDTETNYLNFNCAIVGEEDIPYSKVFINSKGAGNKFTKKFTIKRQDYDIEMTKLKNVVSDDFDFYKYCDEKQQEATEIISSILRNKIGVSDIFLISKDYPFSLYDISYNYNGVTKYVIVFWTATKIKYFNVPTSTLAFCDNFKDNVEVYLISDFLNKKEITKYSSDDIAELDKKINSVMVLDRR